MSRYHSYISTAKKILESYDGSAPLVHHLKLFFSKDKKYGSKDRKFISSLCYSFFRTGRAFNIDKEKKILLSAFLCDHALSKELPGLSEELNTISLPSERIKAAGITVEQIFPAKDLLSEELNEDEFIFSFLKQPSLFLRTRPNKTKAVIDKLKAQDLDFLVEDDCIELANSTKADQFIKINREAVVQDRSSQRALDYLTEHKEQFAGADAWDCCAASGGKSILLFDRMNGKVRLTVSDIRESIMANLKKRMADAGINLHNSFVADLSKTSPEHLQHFSIIICDAPCTGSGTWARTPEQLYYFKKDSIGHYVNLQLSIARNALPFLKRGGLFFYITCSVFKKENEEIVNKLMDEHSLTCLHQDYIKGYNNNADTMFVAVLSLL